jgi:hypothetical protein
LVLFLIIGDLKDFLKVVESREFAQPPSEFRIREDHRAGPDFLFVGLSATTIEALK